MNRPELTCPACRRSYAADSGILSCPQAGAGEEHSLRRTLDWGPGAAEALRRAWRQAPGESFRAFERLITARHLLGAEGYRLILKRIAARLRLLEGRGFAPTPLTAQAALAAAAGRAGRLWVKDETGNVAGSHKGRHLMGTLLHLEALRESGRESARRALAVYSCGNAALAAAAVARAGGYALHAFVPDDLDPAVAALLGERAAVCERIPRSTAGAGDPCYLAFRSAVSQRGWVPFACAGNDNWTNIEGGATLGWELVMQLADRGERLDGVVLQVGGGALARAVSQAFEEALRLGLLAALPRIHVCQPEGGFPFVRAWLLVLAEFARRRGLPFGLTYDRAAEPQAELRRLSAFAGAGREAVRRAVRAAADDFDSPAVQELLAEIPGRSRDFMWPWDGPAPRSLAHGILDDVTYDWYWLLRAMLRAGGCAVIAGEETIRRAWELARAASGIPVCPTGAAGLAGLIELEACGAVDRRETVGLCFTGFDRSTGR
jgi:threonine synthase